MTVDISILYRGGGGNSGVDFSGGGVYIAVQCQDLLLREHPSQGNFPYIG